MIRERTGLIFEGATEEKLRSALLECVPSKKEDAFFNYYERLQADPGEFDRLLLLLTINETFFFRERAHLELLTDVIVPKIRLIKGMQTPIKVMSTGCSTGEEAYSIAIALHERFGLMRSAISVFLPVILIRLPWKKRDRGYIASFRFAVLIGTLSISISKLMRQVHLFW